MRSITPAGNITVLPKIHNPVATIRYALPVSAFAVSTRPMSPSVASMEKPTISSVGAAPSRACHMSAALVMSYLPYVVSVGDLGIARMVRPAANALNARLHSRGHAASDALPDALHADPLGPIECPVGTGCGGISSGSVLSRSRTTITYLRTPSPGSPRARRPKAQ